jgi:glutamate synthase domain-containing protein 2/glutamate synthase domain-containing protein 1/glutamate synthase domain-containing protein 3
MRALDLKPLGPAGADERSACGVGFVASLDKTARHEHLTRALFALTQVEHRGGLLADGKTGDGAGIMAEVPYALLGVARGEVAVGTLFMMLDAEARRRARATLEGTLAAFGLEVAGYRDVPVDTSVLGRQARETLPHISQVFVAWPAFCRTAASFNARLHLAKQALRTALARADLVRRVYMVSLSTSTIVYKALVPGARLADFYPDLRDERFATRFALFHRRFSTNTNTSWDKAQPFRMIAHNGEINTIACNRAWAVAREQALGLPADELLTRAGISDSGSLNEMVEALRYRSSLPHLSEILAIMVPPAGTADPFYAFWGRALEPWDGPAFLAYSDGETVGARLDRNGFRPCRWARTKDAFYLASEAGIFDLDEALIQAKGHLHGGSGAHVELDAGELVFTDPAHARANEGAHFDPRVERVGRLAVDDARAPLANQGLFGFTEEERDRILEPMAAKGKEPIGSMGDTARLAVLSDVRRSFFDFFYQTFAQVTNPPLDALRERTVTDLSMYLGKKPNVFQPKELVPLTPGLALKTPVLSLEELAWIREAPLQARMGRAFEVVELSITFPRRRGPQGLAEALERLQQRALQAIEGGCSVLILSDRRAKPARPPIPSLLALRAVAQAMTEAGRRLDASLVVDTGDARTTHHVAALVGFGAAAVCPYLAFALVRDGYDGGEAARRSERLQTALQDGLLKIMSKMGISTARGYQGAQLFTPVGLGPALLARYFPAHASPLGGLELEDLARQLLAATAAPPAGPLPSPHLLREHNKGEGERHSMTSQASRLVHEVVKDHALTFSAWPTWERYLAVLAEGHPTSPRHLLRLRPAEVPLALEDVQPRQEILRTLGSGAMSFGAISAESQRDLIHALRKVGGRSSSGEGGENPYYFVDGTTATVKQVASGRFGVTAEYLVTGKEIEIKVAQGAKPGEGGQLMAVKVDLHIARARHADPGVDLISPPPLHDIYSIEDLRQLIYELRQLAPEARVVVKLVSGAGIGAIAAGVAKAGADVIQISGGDGGTGAASISSMRHAGLPWELGLADAHQTLVAQELREHVVLRVDGGLSTGLDIVKAALLGAEEYGFGKLLLIAEGCIMARVCEKNTCPRGIATHDPKYKAKYRGQVDDVVTFLHYLAEDVRRHLARAGVRRLDEVIGQAHRLELDPAQAGLAEARRLELRGLQYDLPHRRGHRGDFLAEPTSRLNARLLEDAAPALLRGEAVRGAHAIRTTDRAALATLSGALARRVHQRRMATLPEPPPDPALGTPLPPEDDAALHLPDGTVDLTFTGSAGQGFAVFLTRGVQVTLHGEANDAVAKAMSGGRVIVRPPEGVPFDPEASAIIGNCALYGATGGQLFVRGRAADRFAVRNSGAEAVVEAVGLHACEYMTRGTVVILGGASANVGAGMTGGRIFLRREQASRLNPEYVSARELSDAAAEALHALVAEHRRLTGSATARALLADWPAARATFVEAVSVTQR